MCPSQFIEKRHPEMLGIMKRYSTLINLRIFGSIARGEVTEKSDIALFS